METYARTSSSNNNNNNNSTRPDRSRQLYQDNIEVLQAQLKIVKNEELALQLLVNEREQEFKSFRTPTSRKSVQYFKALNAYDNARKALKAKKQEREDLEKRKASNELLLAQTPVRLPRAPPLIGAWKSLGRRLLQFKIPEQTDYTFILWTNPRNINSSSIDDIIGANEQQPELLDVLRRVFLDAESGNPSQDTLAWAQLILEKVKIVRKGSPARSFNITIRVLVPTKLKSNEESEESYTTKWIKITVDEMPEDDRPDPSIPSTFQLWSAARKLCDTIFDSIKSFYGKGRDNYEASIDSFYPYAFSINFGHTLGLKGKQLQDIRAFGAVDNPTFKKITATSITDGNCVLESLLWLFNVDGFRHEAPRKRANICQDIVNGKYGFAAGICFGADSFAEVDRKMLKGGNVRHILNFINRQMEKTYSCAVYSTQSNMIHIYSGDLATNFSLDEYIKKNSIQDVEQAKKFPIECMESCKSRAARRVTYGWSDIFENDEVGVLIEMNSHVAPYRSTLKDLFEYCLTREPAQLNQSKKTFIYPTKAQKVAKQRFLWEVSALVAIGGLEWQIAEVININTYEKDQTIACANVIEAQDEREMFVRMIESVTFRNQNKTSKGASVWQYIMLDSIDRVDKLFNHCMARSNVLPFGVMKKEGKVVSFKLGTATFANFESVTGVLKDELYNLDFLLSLMPVFLLMRYKASSCLGATTTASFARKLFKSQYLETAKLTPPIEVCNIIRENAYTGGMIDNFQDGLAQSGEIMAYDINQAYPSNSLGPLPVWFRGTYKYDGDKIEDTDYYEFTFDFTNAKHDLLPFFSIRTQCGTCYPLKGRTCKPGVMLKEAIDIGTKVEIFTVHKFYSQRLLKEFMTDGMKRRLNEKDPRRKHFFKGIQNTLIGALAPNPTQTWRCVDQRTLDNGNFTETSEVMYQREMPNGTKMPVYLAAVEPKEKPNFVAVSAYVVSLTTLQLVRALRLFKPKDRICCNTDGMIVRGRLPSEMVGNQPGQFKHEDTFTTVWTIGPGRYLGVREDGTCKVRLGLTNPTAHIYEPKEAVFNEDEKITVWTSGSRRIQLVEGDPKVGAALLTYFNKYVKRHKWYLFDHMYCSFQTRFKKTINKPMMYTSRKRIGQRFRPPKDVEEFVWLRTPQPEIEAPPVIRPCFDHLRPAKAKKADVTE